MLHFPVLLEESVDFLLNDLNGHYIDCTFGRGGHSKLILEKLTKDGFLTGIDKDPDAYEYATKLKNNNFKIINDSFKNIEKYFEEESISVAFFMISEHVQLILISLKGDLASIKKVH